MSFITIEHTAAAWIDKELTKGLKFALKSTTIVYGVLSYASTIIEKVVGLVKGTATEKEVTEILSEALSLLAAAKSAIYDTQDVTTIGSLLDKIIANLNTILTDAHITNADHVALITKVLKALDAVVKAIENQLNATATTTTA